MPSTGTSILRNRSIARVASISDRSCGVETMIAPSGRDFWISESCTSPVPGGRSTTSTSASPQSASTSLRSEEHTSELQSQFHLVCRLLLEKKKKKKTTNNRYTYI